VRFIMDASIFRTPVLNHVFRGMKAIPVAPEKKDPVVYERAFEVVRQELAAGELVCIFPEGRLSVDGELAPFRAGMMRILDETPVPVIPMAVSGLWGSMFSRYEKAVLLRAPRKLFARITLRIGGPLPPQDIQPEILRELTLTLRGPQR
jgi:1-acyl-sn-glycerol-3-phosphate acyltransferase